ncbi:MAG: hypothetical protein NTW29_11995 [Bacteroidetes bacterium]|nr:hypothetical protein [Bacteroidota bacterium]
MIKQTFFIILLCCVCFTAVAQDEKITAREEEEVKYFQKVELSAHFPGGERAWSRFVERGLDLNAVLSALPDSVTEWSDSVLVCFIVNKKGEITEPRLEGNNKAIYEKPVLDLLKKSAAWQPELQGSGPVKAFLYYRFYFIMAGDMSSVTIKRFRNREGIPFPSD